MSSSQTTEYHPLQPNPHGDHDTSYPPQYDKKFNTNPAKIGRASGKMPQVSIPASLLLGLLMLDALLEIAFISSMVSYLHISHHDVPWRINAAQGSFEVFPKPAHVLANQGHTSNGAAGTAFFLAGLLGFIVLWVDGSQRLGKKNLLSRLSPFLRIAWPVFAILSVLLTTSALIYTFIVTSQTSSKHQIFSIPTGIANSGLPYPTHNWTPENWYKQVLALPFADPSQRGDIQTHLNLMEGWRWNLIPLFLLGLCVAGAAVAHTVEQRQMGTLRGKGQRIDGAGKA